MRRPTTQNAFTLLTALAAIALASSANAAIVTPGAASTSWSVQPESQPRGMSASAEAYSPDSQTPPAANGLFAVDRSLGSSPGDMSGQSSTQNNISVGVAILSVTVSRVSETPSDGVATQSAAIVSTWRGDEMLDPPKAAQHTLVVLSRTWLTQQLV